MQLNSLLKTIHTKHEQTQFVAKLDTLSQSLFDVKESVSEKLTKIFSQEERQAVELFLSENKIGDDPMDIQKALQEVKKIVHAMPVVLLEIAIEPSPEMINAIQAWFSLSLKTHYIIDIKVNKSIIGAACITVNGKYKDYSVKKQLEHLDLKQLMQ